VRASGPGGSFAQASPGKAVNVLQSLSSELESKYIDIRMPDASPNFVSVVTMYVCMKDASTHY
jgi:hypothetical protein